MHTRIEAPQNTKHKYNPQPLRKLSDLSTASDSSHSENSTVHTRANPYQVQQLTHSEQDNRQYPPYCDTSVQQPRKPLTTKESLISTSSHGYKNKSLTMPTLRHRRVRSPSPTLTKHNAGSSNVEAMGDDQRPKRKKAHHDLRQSAKDIEAAYTLLELSRAARVHDQWQFEGEHGISENNKHDGHGHDHMVSESMQSNPNKVLNKAGKTFQNASFIFDNSVGRTYDDLPKPPIPAPYSKHYVAPKSTETDKPKPPARGKVRTKKILAGKGKGNKTSREAKGRFTKVESDNPPATAQAGPKGHIHSDTSKTLKTNGTKNKLENFNAEGWNALPNDKAEVPAMTNSFQTFTPAGSMAQKDPETKSDNVVEAADKIKSLGISITRTLRDSAKWDEEIDYLKRG